MGKERADERDDESDRRRDGLHSARIPSTQTVSGASQCIESGLRSTCVQEKMWEKEGPGPAGQGSRQSGRSLSARPSHDGSQLLRAPFLLRYALRKWQLLTTEKIVWRAQCLQSGGDSGRGCYPPATVGSFSYSSPLYLCDLDSDAVALVRLGLRDR